MEGFRHGCVAPAVLLRLRARSHPQYLAPCPRRLAGQSALWKHQAVSRQDDQRVGLWSDVVSVAVNG